MLRLAFAGTPEFSVPALRALAQSPHHLVGVLTQPDRPAGRGRELKPGPVKSLALSLGLPLSQPARLRTEEERASLASWQCDALIVVAYGLILPPAVLALPRLGCINIHASLLPRWRGAAPIQRAILAGDTETGVSIMRLEAGLDTGPLYAQQRLPIDGAMTGETLAGALAALGATLLLQTLEGLDRGVLEPWPQPAEGVSYAAKIDKAEARIDWQRDATAIGRQVRAFNPWPVAETRWQDQQLRIWEAAPGGAHIAAAGPPGTVLGLEQGQLLVRCGEGILAIARLQLPGRRVVTAADFARGRSLDGARFT